MKIYKLNSEQYVKWRSAENVGILLEQIWENRAQVSGFFHTIVGVTQDSETNFQELNLNALEILDTGRTEGAIQYYKADQIGFYKKAPDGWQKLSTGEFSFQRDNIHFPGGFVLFSGKEDVNWIKIANFSNNAIKPITVNKKKK